MVCIENERAVTLQRGKRVYVMWRGLVEGKFEEDHLRVKARREKVKLL